ncbi:MAG: fibronectin type III domain-containing protein [Dehalococcoidales bacterium]|nr:fibronectin type III domain-containing protein [Dehalococcoidales bacterium]
MCSYGHEEELSRVSHICGHSWFTGIVGKKEIKGMVSFKNAKIWRTIMTVFLVLSMTILNPVNQVFAADITHQLSNMGDKSLTISWFTELVEPGHVKYGTDISNLNNIACDKRGRVIQDTTHYVTMTNLIADTTYYYEIVSGSITDNNNGNMYSVTTGPDLDFPPMPEIISGKVYHADGITTANGAIVNVSIGASQLLSALVDINGSWGMDIAAIRIADYKQYQTCSGNDCINISVQEVIGNTPTNLKISLTSVKSCIPVINLLQVTDNKRIAADAVPQSSNITINETLSEKTENITDNGINLWLVIGIPAGIIAIALIAWYINKYRY